MKICDYSITWLKLGSCLIKHNNNTIYYVLFDFILILQTVYIECASSFK